MKENTVNSEIEKYSEEIINDEKINIIDKQKNSNDISLIDADIVISGGRGLKGPDNWEMIEELANLLNAGTACSKPVSDMDWRPHSEHVGQTGIAINPDLFFIIKFLYLLQHQLINLISLMHQLFVE